MSDSLLPERLRACLRTRLFGAEIRYARELDSTQRAAWEAAQAGAAEGTIFVADGQSGGRGRHGHSWASPAGAGIYASLVLRPGLAPAAMQWLTLAAGLAVADAVFEVAGLRAEIRWPNDLLLEGRKFCGLLTEASLEGERVVFAVLGFGINVHAAPLPPELAGLATALDAHARHRVSRPLLCAAVLRHLEERYLLMGAGPGPADGGLRAEFERRCRYARGLEVAVGGAQPFRGVTAGLDDFGYLKVRLGDGSERVVTAGDVRPAV